MAIRRAVHVHAQEIGRVAWSSRRPAGLESLGILPCLLDDADGAVGECEGDLIPAGADEAPQGEVARDRRDDR
jgi:hypothetical protein